MVNKVVDYIKKWNMIEEGDVIITGVSGGADSVCLLHILNKLKNKFSFSIVVVHIEHGIRGVESELDARFVENIAMEYNLKYRQYSYEVRKIAKEYRLSEEEAGRKVRYEAFMKALYEFNANKIAVAHNQQDNAETMLMNLFRGSGLQGMGGIVPVRDQIIRPLLCLNRNEIENYLKKEGIVYRTDRTNLLEDYTRNKIRNRIMPYITQEINLKAVEHMAQTANQMQEVYQYVEEQAQIAFYKCVQLGEGIVEIPIDLFQKENNFIQKQMIRLAIQYLIHQLKDISSVHIKNIYELTEKSVNKTVDLPYSLVAKRTYKSIIITHRQNIRKEKVKKSEDLNMIIQVPGTYQLEDDKIEIEFSLIEEKNFKKNLIIPEKRYTKWLDCDRINSALQIRHRQPGDYIMINENFGKKKLKDYFIEQKIPREDRQNIVLLADGSHILWIIGYRISEYYKVTNTTKNILKVQVNGGNIHERRS